MSDQRPKRRHDDNTTDFFLNFIKQEKKQESEEKHRQTEIKARTNQTVSLIARVYNAVNKILDMMLNSNRSLMVLSLVLTLFLFFSFTGDNLSSTSSGRIIRHVPVDIEGLSDDYCVSGIPESVSVGLIGPAVTINGTRIATNYSVYVDLSGLGEGSHTVPLQTKNFSTALSVWILPETVMATIEKKKSETFDLKYQFDNTESIGDDYNITIGSLSDEAIKVTAGASQLNRINYVQILVDVNNRTNSFTQECSVYAFDARGDLVECDMSPKTVTVQCNVEAYSKVVAIKPEFIGKVKKGYKMSGYKLSSSTVTLYGSRSAISDITAVGCDVDITGLSKTKTIKNIPLNMDTNVDKSSIKSIDVVVTIEKK